MKPKGGNLKDPACEAGAPEKIFIIVLGFSWIYVRIL